MTRLKPAVKPWWQQVTALVSLSTGGAVTGFSFVPKAAAEITTPSSMPINLVALDKAAQPAPATDAALRSAIVKVANYYLRMAQHKTPAEMEAIIWQHDSLDGVDHGESCAAFASLTLALGAHAVGEQSWVTGGTTYPWPLHKWADVRVDPNPGSLGITSVLQDAQAHDRWHPLGDGYRPQPGDWVLFDGHVEVVTRYAGGVLDTIGGDSVPNFSVNAHQYPAPLGAQGVVGFVDNGALPGGPQTASRATPASAKDQPAAAAELVSIPGAPRRPAHKPVARAGGADIPEMVVPAGRPGRPVHRQQRQHVARTELASAPTRRAEPGSGVTADVPGIGFPVLDAAATAQAPGSAAIPGLARSAHHTRFRPAPRSAPVGGGWSPAPTAAQTLGTASERTFIDQIAPGAVATQRVYGVPASVTIAQAILESGWGQSGLATGAHNLFGMKGEGPAGSVSEFTQEYENGQMVTIPASFRAYDSVAESIIDHGKLLATSPYYTQAMSDRHDPNAFAAALTGVYATDPTYGTQLIGLMRQYNLYRYDAAAPSATTHHATHKPRQGGAEIPGLQPAGRQPAAKGQARSPEPRSTPVPTRAPGRQARPPGPGPARVPTRAASPPTRRPDSHATPRPSTSTRPSAWPEPTGPPTPEPTVAARPPSPTARPTTLRSATHPARGRLSAAQGHRESTQPPAQVVTAERLVTANRSAPGKAARVRSSGPARPYEQHIPLSVKNAFLTKAKLPLADAEPLYRDVAHHNGLPWELLAAADWMQCQARARYSPVHGERLGTVNSDGTTYLTRSAALEQCAVDLVDLSRAVYQVDLAGDGQLSIADLANAFAAFRWGGLLKQHHISALEFPYSVAGLTDHHLKMRWPAIDAPNAPDKSGTRFRMPFGAVTVALSLNYPATV